jgi:hypothetical protein
MEKATFVQALIFDVDVVFVVLDVFVVQARRFSRRRR